MNKLISLVEKKKRGGGCIIFEVNPSPENPHLTVQSRRPHTEQSTGPPRGPLNLSPAASRGRSRRALPVHGHRRRAQRLRQDQLELTESHFTSEAATARRCSRNVPRPRTKGRGCCPGWRGRKSSSSSNQKPLAQTRARPAPARSAVTWRKPRNPTAGPRVTLGEPRGRSAAQPPRVRGAEDRRHRPPAAAAAAAAASAGRASLRGSLSPVLRLLPRSRPGRLPPAHLHPGPRRLSRAHLGEPGSAARGTSSPPRARPAAPHRSQLPAPPRPRAPHPPRGRKRAEDTPTTGRQRAGPGLDAWGGGSRLKRKDLRAPNPRRERRGPAGRPLPALLHLRVSLEFQQVQMLGHEALHSRGGHGRRPAGPGAAEIPAGPRASTHTARARAASASASGRGCGKMAAAVAARAMPVCFRRLLCACSRRGPRAAGPGAASLGSASQRFGSQSTSVPQGYVPKTSLSSPPWPEVVLPDPAEETRHHAEVVGKVNELIATGQYGRLFAVVHFASHQWKVTSEDLILINNELDIACGERIRLEKVLLVGADNFTLLGKPLLGKDLVRVEATVIEKTESWPKINMKFKKRKNYRKTKVIVNPQTVLRINTIEIAPCLC
uniref:Large ribosomal subunit protein bL21m n=2 Tax=Canis lupus familiaris TaxID=9615 RepID=A0A8C0PC43_CANLF